MFHIIRLHFNFIAHLLAINILLYSLPFSGYYWSIRKWKRRIAGNHSQTCKPLRSHRGQAGERPESKRSVRPFPNLFSFLSSCPVTSQSSISLCILCNFFFNLYILKTAMSRIYQVKKHYFFETHAFSSKRLSGVGNPIPVCGQLQNMLGHVDSSEYNTFIAR